MGTCIFCGPTDKKITAEHLFADWISWAFHPERKPKQYRLSHRNKKGRDKKWYSASIDHKAHLLCETCNNEWFSDLENCVKPIVTPMMLHGRQTMLSIEDQSHAERLDREDDDCREPHV